MWGQLQGRREEEVPLSLYKQGRGSGTETAIEADVITVRPQWEQSTRVPSHRQPWGHRIVTSYYGRGRRRGKAMWRRGEGKEKEKEEEEKHEKEEKEDEKEE
jgi:hypothetical protein